VGQKSWASLFTGAGSILGVPNSPPLLARIATQMSSSPPGPRIDAMYRPRPVG
jgi:hypothetical protein